MMDKIKDVLRSDILDNDQWGVDIIAFWMVGLCNNFAYIVMLSAAHDILQSTSSYTQTVFVEVPAPGGNQNASTHLLTASVRKDTMYDCNPISTGAILLADIVPTLFLKILAPFFLLSVSYNVRISFVIVFGFLSLLIVSVAMSTWESILGVVFASLGAGLGDYSFLSLSSYYHRNALSAWASGTGASGLFGSLSYAGLISLGVTSQNTLLIMLFVPCLMGITFFLMLHKPSYIPGGSVCLSSLTSPPPADALSRRNASDSDLVKSSADNSPSTNSGVYPTLELADTSGMARERTGKGANEPVTSGTITPGLSKKVPLLPKGHRLSYYNNQKPFDFKGRAVQISKLFPYMLPLVVVYFSEYLINQGLFELTYFRGIWLDHASQYRWYLVDYQLGVFISRSSFKVLPMPYLWIFPILQVLNLIIFVANVHFFFIPSIWIIFVLIFFEGFIGGAAYVNTFHKIAFDYDDPGEREISLGAASLADSMGIALAGFVSLPIHKYFCTRF